MSCLLKPGLHVVEQDSETTDSPRDLTQEPISGSMHEKEVKDQSSTDEHSRHIDASLTRGAGGWAYSPCRLIAADGNLLVSVPSAWISYPCDLFATTPQNKTSRNLCNK